MRTYMHPLIQHGLIHLCSSTLREPPNGEGQLGAILGILRLLGFVFKSYIVLYFILSIHDTGYVNSTLDLI